MSKPLDWDASRRSFLGIAIAGFASVALARPFGGRPLSIPNATTGAIPLLSPGGSFTGAPKSGGIPAVFGGGSTATDPITRTTAKPAIHWLFPSDLRLVTNRTLGVDADCNGGVLKVTIHCEGAEVDILTPSWFTDLDANGNSRTRWGWWFTLNAAAFRAITTTGEARLFATAVPKDGTMQSRIIGYDTVAVADGVHAVVLDGSYPMSVFPRTALNDQSKTVRADGTGDFTTIQAAIDDAATFVAGGGEAPLITIAQTHAYEVTNTTRTIGAGWPVAKSRCTITTSPGVTATLGRAAAFAPSTPASWSWTPGLDGIEFQGSGIVFDQLNWSQIMFTAKPAWLNGCKFTNSTGTLYSYYWNGGVHPGFAPSVPSYWDGAAVEHVSLQAALGGQRYVMNTSVNEYCQDVFTATHYVAYNYVRYFSYQFFTGTFQGTTNHTAISITGPAGATVSKTALDVQGGNLLLRVSGSTVLTISLGFYGNDTNPTINDVIAAINAFGSGWSASAQNSRGTMRASSIGTPTGVGGQTFTDLVASTALNLNAGVDIHGDWWQGFVDGITLASSRQNVMIRNNTCRDASQVNSAMFNDDYGNNDQSLDHIVKGNVWLGSYGTMTFGAASMGHFVFENNTAELTVIRDESSAGDTTYCSFRNNIIGTVATTPTFNMAQTSDAPFINNVMMTGSGYTATNGQGSNTGNVLYTNPGGNLTTNMHALFRDYTNGDVRPALTGLLESNLIASVNDNDGSGVAYSLMDVAGARSANGSAPSYPF